MNEEIDIVEKILELVQARDVFDLQSYDQTLAELEKIVGKELEHGKEKKDVDVLINHVKEEVLTTLSGKTNLENIGQAMNGLMRFQDEYMALKRKYMDNDIHFLIDYVKKTDNE